MAIKFLFNQRLGEKAAKENRRVTLTEVHKNTGISKNALVNLSKGDVTRINFTTLDALCDFFECKPGDFFERV